MNSKERVLAAIEHREPDRVPLGYGAWREVSEALCSHLGVDPACDWSHWQVYPEALLQRLHVDIRIVRATYIGPDPSYFEDGSYIDMWGIRQSKDNYPIGNPLSHATTPADIDAHPFPDPDALDYAHYAERLDQFEEYAVCGGDWSPFFTMALETMGTEQFLVAMHTMPDVAHALLQRTADYYLETTGRMFEAARRPDGTSRLDIFFMGDDYGTQRGPFVSHKDFCTFIAPHLERFYRLAKSYGLKVMHHSCGSVRGLLPDLIALGADVLDPVQVRAKGMEPAALKRDFGTRITFHGSIDTQQTLPQGTPADVRAEVLDRLDHMAPGGGFILSGSQDYISDIPVENIAAIYDTAYEYGGIRAIEAPSVASEGAEHTKRVARD